MPLTQQPNTQIGPRRGERLYSGGTRLFCSFLGGKGMSGTNTKTRLRADTQTADTTDHQHMFGIIALVCGGAARKRRCGRGAHVRDGLVWIPCVVSGEGEAERLVMSPQGR
jgi:hypothetical protein